MVYTGSSDHTGRSWVAEFGDPTRIYKGHKHTVSFVKYHDGLRKCNKYVVLLTGLEATWNNIVLGTMQDVSVNHLLDYTLIWWTVWVSNILL